MKELTRYEVWKEKEKTVLNKIKYQKGQNEYFSGDHMQAANMLKRGEIELLLLQSHLRLIQCRLNNHPEQPSQE